MAVQTITVANAAELNQALASATGGETILLAAGDYGALNVNGMQYASDVTIKSADPNAMASFSTASLYNSSHITFDTIKFDYNFASGDKYYNSPFKVESSNNITFANSLFDGDTAHSTGTAADGLGISKGLFVNGSSDINVVGTEFHSWWTALSVINGQDVHIAGNNIHDIRSDGIKLNNLDNTLVENNYIHDFSGTDALSDHRDMIQVQRPQGDGVTNLTIRDNVFDMGSGSWTQTIWMGVDKANGNDPTNWHSNVLIENNVIYNSHTHGISINLTHNLSIRKNSVIRVRSAKSGGVSIPAIRVSPNSTSVVIERNTVSKISGYKNQRDWVVLNNALIQDTSPSAPGYYDREFIYHATGSSHGYHEYGVRPGSAIDQLNAGSALVKNYPTRR